MDPHLIDLLAFLIGGALIAVIVGVPLFVAGRRSKEGAVQSRAMNRELLQQRQAWLRRLEAIRKAFLLMKGHPETRPHVALYLEEYIEPLLADRAPAGDPPPRPPWWRRLWAWLKRAGG